MNETAETKEDKSVSRSVSMPFSVWEVVEAHAPTTPGKDRSGYIRNLVEANLRSAGKLGNGSTSDVKFHAQLNRALETAPELRAKIEKLTRAALKDAALSA